MNPWPLDLNSNTKMCSMFSYHSFKAIWVVSVIGALSTLGNGVASVGMPRATCVDNWDWSGSDWEVPVRVIQDDCHHAADVMLNTDMTTYGNGWFEFVNGDRPGTYGRHPVLSTPRKYTSGT